MKAPSTPISLPRATRRLRRATSPAAFTLIELLVVLGIILILIGLFFTGLKHVTQQAKERDSKSMLQTCASMLDNYKQATSFSRVPSLQGATFTSANNLVGTPTLFWTEGQEIAPGSISSDSLSYNNFAALPPAVQNTIIMMYALQSVHDNASILSKIPSNKILSVQALGVTVPLLLDGWGDPILFAPGGGLTGVWVDPTDNQNKTQVITSVGVQANGYDPTLLPAGTLIPNQPFFFSAGVDGDASNQHNHAVPLAGPPAAPPSDMTDDNIYSFQN